MLVLRRCLNESVKIGDEVTVTIVSIKRDEVRLAFIAPPEMDVDREEVRRRKKVNANQRTRGM